MADNGNTTDLLDSVFDSARREPPVLGPDFMSRLQADMEAHLPTPKATNRPPAPGLFSRFATLFAASGLTGAAALGVWIGFVIPETLNTLSGYDMSQTTDIGAFLPSADLAALSE